MTLQKELEELIKAWEVLPEGHHSSLTVAAWLASHMKPAINNARAAIAEDKCSFEDLQDIIKEYCFNVNHEGDKYCLHCCGIELHQLDCPIGRALDVHDS